MTRYLSQIPKIKLTAAQEREILGARIVSRTNGTNGHVISYDHNEGDFLLYWATPSKALVRKGLARASGYSWILTPEGIEMRAALLKEQG